MRAVRNHRLHNFDSTKNFVWLRTARVNGVQVTRGAAVNKTRFSRGDLQRMYESTRLINYGAGQRPRGRGRKV